MEATSILIVPDSCGSELSSGCAAVLSSCLRRLNRWRLPPNWSSDDWSKEIKAVGTLAIWEAEREFDPAREVPLAAFLYQRVMARVLTRYRQEWTYGLHIAPELDEEFDCLVIEADVLLLAETVHESLRNAINSLPDPDRHLIQRLFWQDCSENQIACELGISQSAVSKRKRFILRQLRWQLGNGSTG